MTKVGYARVSTLEQNIDLQLDALKGEGCKKVFTDKVSGAKASKPSFEKLLEYVRPGDTIVVWKLDRLGKYPAVNRAGGEAKADGGASKVYE